MKTTDKIEKHNHRKIHSKVDKIKRSKEKPSEQEISLLRNLSNGTSNWDHLVKMLGPASKKTDTKRRTFKEKTNEPRTVQNTKSEHLVPTVGRKKWEGYSAKLPVVPTKIENYNDSHSSINNNNVQSVNKNELQETSQPTKSNQITQSENEIDMQKSSLHAKSVPTEKSRLFQKFRDKIVALDCEMVGTGTNGEDSMIARVSIVDGFGNCIYDVYVTPKDDITDYRTSVSGIRPSDLKNGKELFDVQKDVLNILEGKILIGHALKHDMDVLFIHHPRHMIRDTARYKPLRDLCGGRTPSLKKLAKMLLGVDIQSGEHSSVEDAQAALQIYFMHKSQWEKGLKERSKRVRSRQIQQTMRMEDSVNM